MNRRPSSLRTPLSPRTIALVVGALAGLFVALSACSNQGEGERCNFLNGDEDCGDGLVCYQSTQLKDSNADRCCPVDRTTATNPFCQTGGSSGIDASAPTDSGPSTPPPASASDAGTDAADAADGN